MPLHHIYEAIYHVLFISFSYYTILIRRIVIYMFPSMLLLLNRTVEPETALGNQ